MNPIAKTGLGIVAIAPLLSFILVFVVIFSFAFSMADIDMHKTKLPDDPDARKAEVTKRDRAIFSHIWPIFMVYPLFFLSLFAFPIVYIVLAAMNDALDAEKKALWIVLLFVFGMFAMPAYWIVYVRTSRPKPAGQEPTAATG